LFASVLLLGLTAAAGLAGPVEVRSLLERAGAADLLLLADPEGPRPARVLLATRVAASPRRVCDVVMAPASYRKAMPSFRRVDVIARRARGPGITDLQVAWELDVPLWNLKGKLWVRPRADGVDLVLEEGDLVPGLLHLTVHPEGPARPERSLLVIEGFANLAQANVAAREIARRSPLAEPAMTAAAVYVLMKALARLAEEDALGRPSAPLVAPELLRLDGALTGAAASTFSLGRGLLAAVRCRPDGRLAGVEVAAHASPRAVRRALGGPGPERFRVLPGWKRIEEVGAHPDACQDPSAFCWAVEANLPGFSLDGTWKIRTRPWRARMVAGEREGAIMAVDVVAGRGAAPPVIVFSEHPRLDRAGFLPRKLVAAEPFLEHGLALALTLVDAASLLRALERDQK